MQQADVYSEHKDLYVQYQAIRRPKKQAKFREEHYTGIALFEAAKRHLLGAINGSATESAALPLKNWQTEHEMLSARRNELSRKYASLKREVREIEQVRRGLDFALREETRRTAPQREMPKRTRIVER